MKSPLLLRPLFADRPRPGAVDIDELASTLKAVADPARLKILSLLSRRGPITVTRLAPLLNLSQPTVSHHMGILRAVELVDATKAGRETLYALDVDAMARVSQLIHPRRHS